MVPELRRGMTASCDRCSTILLHTTTHPLGHSMALTIAALVLLLVMCTTTLMSVQTAGIAHSAFLLSGPAELVARGFGDEDISATYRLKSELFERTNIMDAPARRDA